MSAPRRAAMLRCRVRCARKGCGWTGRRLVWSTWQAVRLPCPWCGSVVEPVSSEQEGR